MANSGALGSAPIASFPLAGNPPAVGNVGSASGSATVSGVLAAIAVAVAAASGSASVSGVGAGPNTVATATASGSATVSGYSSANDSTTALASGSAVVTGVGKGVNAVVGNSTGSALVYGVAPLLPSKATATGSATVIGRSPASLGTATGAAIVLGASPTNYQTGVGASAGIATVSGVAQVSGATIARSYGTSSAQFYAATGTKATSSGSAGVLGKGSASGQGYTPYPPFVYAFIAGTHGPYVEPIYGGSSYCCNCPTTTPSQPLPTNYLWAASSLTNARVCDISWIGDRIIVGRASSLWGADSAVYLTDNFGANWSILPVTPDNWVNVTMSADGSLCGAYPLDTQVTYSSFDYGASWQSNARLWGASQTNSAEISDDGTTVIVTANPGNQIYLSNNNGISWATIDTGLLPWYEFYTASCINQNGSIQFAGRSLDKMHSSFNSGGLWSVCSNSYAAQFSKVACDSSGYYVVATGTSTTGFFEVSRDAGITWTKYGVNPDDNTDGWSTCAVSGDGRVMAVGKYGGRLDISTDFGATWKTQNVDGLNGTYLWTDIGINYEGTVIVACALNGPIFIATAI